MRVFSDLVITFNIGLTFVAQEAIYSLYNLRISMSTYRFRWTFNLYKAHSAVSGNRQPLVIAESGNLNSTCGECKLFNFGLTRPHGMPDRLCSWRRPILNSK